MISFGLALAARGWSITYLGPDMEEELGIRSAIGDEITRYEFTYPDKPAVELIFFRVTNYQGEPRNLIFQEMRWARPEALPALDFVEGDRDFLSGFAQTRPQ